MKFKTGVVRNGKVRHLILANGNSACGTRRKSPLHSIKTVSSDNITCEKCVAKMKDPYWIKVWNLPYPVGTIVEKQVKGGALPNATGTVVDWYYGDDDSIFYTVQDSVGMSPWTHTEIISSTPAQNN